MQFKSTKRLCNPISWKVLDISKNYPYCLLHEACSCSCGVGYFWYGIGDARSFTHQLCVPVLTLPRSRLDLAFFFLYHCYSSNTGGYCCQQSVINVYNLSSLKNVQYLLF